jgi:hypothetical protein
MAQNLSCFTLENNNPSIEFSLQYPSSIISIQKISIVNLLDRMDPVPFKPFYTFNHDFVIPGYNLRNKSEKDFCKEIKIELMPIREELTGGLSLTFFYEATPGVVPKDISRVY